MRCVKLVVLAVILALTGVHSVTADEEATADQSEAQEILAELTEALDLNEEQQQQVAGHLQTFVQTMHEVTEGAEDEEKDPQATLGAIKKARSEFNKGMEGALSKEQFEQFEAMVDAIIQETFEDIAEIKLMDLELPLELTQEQMVALVPVLGTSIRNVVGVIFEYGDKKLNTRTKIKMGKKLKGIQSETEKSMKTILSDEQMEKYKAYKEAKKAANEEAKKE